MLDYFITWRVWKLEIKDGGWIEADDGFVSFVVFFSWALRRRIIDIDCL